MKWWIPVLMIVGGGAVIYWAYRSSTTEAIEESKDAIDRMFSAEAAECYPDRACLRDVMEKYGRL
jgi:hypothetical protein